MQAHNTEVIWLLPRRLVRAPEETPEGLAQDGPLQSTYVCTRHGLDCCPVHVTFLIWLNSLTHFFGWMNPVSRRLISGSGGVQLDQVEVQPELVVVQVERTCSAYPNAI